jgi:hypothetical protein
MPLVVRQLQVGHRRTVPVPPPRLPQIHTYSQALNPPQRRPTRHKSCAYTKSALRTPRAADQAPCPTASPHMPTICGTPVRRRWTYSDQQVPRRGLDFAVVDLVVRLGRENPR